MPATVSVTISEDSRLGHRVDVVADHEVKRADRPAGNPHVDAGESTSSSGR